MSQIICAVIIFMWVFWGVVIHNDNKWDYPWPPSLMARASMFFYAFIGGALFTVGSIVVILAVLLLGAGILGYVK